MDLESTDCCNIANVVAVSSRRRGQNERRHDHLMSCIYRVDILGDWCWHCGEEIKKGNKDIYINWSRGVHRIETEAGNFV